MTDQPASTEDPKTPSGSGTSDGTEPGSSPAETTNSAKSLVEQIHTPVHEEEDELDLDSESSEPKPEGEDEPDPETDPQTPPAEALSEEQKKRILSGESGKISGEKSFEIASQKATSDANQALESADEAALDALGKKTAGKPKLIQSVTEGLFDSLEAGIVEGEAKALAALEQLQRSAPHLAEELAKKFSTDDGPVGSVEELFSAIGHEATAPQTTTEVKDSFDVEKTLLEVDKRAFGLMHQLGQTSWDEFQKTPVYRAVLDQASKFAQKGFAVADFWELLEKSTLSAIKDQNTKREQAAATAAHNAPESTDISAENLSEEDEDFMQSIGLSSQAKERIRKQAAAQVA